MIEQISNWSKEIVISVIIITIIELLLPENSLKKYIKVIMGIFIVFVVISPLIKILSQSQQNTVFNVRDFNDGKKIMVNSSNDIVKSTDDSIRKIFSQNLINDLKIKLKEKGYIVDNVIFKISKDNSYNIEEIRLKVIEKIKVENNKETKTIVDHIKTVKIKIEDNKKESNSIISVNEKSSLIDFISSTYEIDKSKIIIE